MNIKIVISTYNKSLNTLANKKLKKRIITLCDKNKLKNQIVESKYFNTIIDLICIEPKNLEEVKKSFKIAKLISKEKVLIIDKSKNTYVVYDTKLKKSFLSVELTRLSHSIAIRQPAYFYFTKDDVYYGVI